MGNDVKSKATRDRNLLFGVIAVQMRFIKPADLARAAAQWAVDPAKDLGAVLIEMKLIGPEARAAIHQMLDLQVKQHQGDPSATLQSFGGGRAVHESFSASLAPIEKDGQAGVALIEKDEEFSPIGGDDKVRESQGPWRAERIDDSSRITLEHPGRYSIKGEYGRGAIGHVLIAFDEHVGREVALKELIPQSGAAGPDASPGGSPLRKTAEATARFLREARVTGQLEHPGIVPVYEIGRRADGSTYYTMKLVRGKTLADKLKECKSLPDRLRLLPHYLELCHAVAYAHSKGVIHRDLKPANIMVGEFGETVVLDWGLAKVKGLSDIRAEDLEAGLKLLQDAAAGETAKGAPIGTPSYMSPEQAEGDIDAVDERSDVWSLGAILYELLTGAPPFTGKTAYEVMGLVISKGARPVNQVEPKAPPDLAAIADQCLLKDRQERYANAGAIAADVSAFLSGGRVSAYEYSLAEVAKKWVVKHRAPFMTALAALLLLGALGFWSVHQIRRERDLARRSEKKAVATLGEFYFSMGNFFSETRHWDRARIFFANLLALEDTPMGRLRLSFTQTLPAIKVDLIHTLMVGEKPVKLISFSPDGKIMAGSSMDGAVRLWEIGGGKLLQRLEGGEHPTIALHFNPETTTLTRIDDQADLELWEINRGQKPSELQASGEKIQLLGLCSDRESAAAVFDAELKVLELSTRRPIRSWPTPGKIHGLAFSPDCQTLALGVEDGSIQLFDIATGVPPRTLRGHHDIVLGLAFSPDGKILTSGSADKTLILWDLADAKPIRVLTGHEGSVLSLVFHPNGKTLASGSVDDSIRLWDVASGKTINVMEGHSGRVVALAFSPDGQILASAAGDKTVKLWRLSTSQTIHELVGHQDSIASLIFSPDGKWLASTSADRTTLLWDVSRDAPVKVFTGPLPSDRAITFAPDSKLLALAGGDHAVSLWDTPSGQPLPALEAPGANLEVVAFSPDAKLLATAGKDGRVFLHAIATRELLLEINAHPDAVTALQFLPDGKTLVSVGADRTMKLWNPLTGKLISELGGHRSGLLSFALSPDGKTLAAGYLDSELEFWNLYPSALIRSMKAHEGRVSVIAFSPDGQTLASGSWDNTIKLWDPTTGNLIHTLKDHRSSIYALRFSPDGKTLFSGGKDNSIKIWDLATGKLIDSWEEHTDSVMALALSSDGKSLASAGKDRVIRIWPLQPQVTDRLDPQQLLPQAERDTGLKVKGIDVYPWDPETGEVSEKPLPRPF